MTVVTTSQSRSVAVSALSQLVAKALHLLLNVISTLAILHYLAPAAYGSYVLVVTVVTLAGVVADFGLPQLAVREIVRAPSERTRAQDEILGTTAALRLGLALGAVLGCQAVLLVLGQPLVVHQAAAIASVLLLVDAVLSVVLVSFQVHVEQQYEAIVRVTVEALETGLILLLIARQADLIWLFVPPVVAVAVGLVLALALARRRYRLRLRPARHRVSFLLAEALPIGPALIVAAVYLKLDSLVLAAMRPLSDVGIYGSAYQPVEYLFLGTAVIMNVLFPMLAGAWAGGDPARFLQLYRRTSELLVIATAFVPLVFAFTAPAVVRVAFGGAYAEAARPLQILSVALVAMTVSAWQSLALISAGLQRLILVYNSVTLVVALGLCTLLVWRFGPMGAALSVLATSCVLLFASLRAVRRRLGSTLDAGQMVRILMAVAVTAGVLALLGLVQAHWLLMVLVAAVCYVLALHRFGLHVKMREAFG